MSTIILFWNPDISSYSMERHHNLLAQADAARLKKIFEASCKANSDKIWTPKYLL